MLFHSGTASATTGMICALNCPVDATIAGKTGTEVAWISSMSWVATSFSSCSISPFSFQQSALLLSHSVLRQQIPAAPANSHPSSICATSLMGPCVCWDKWPWKAMKIAGQFCVWGRPRNDRLDGILQLSSPRMMHSLWSPSWSLFCHLCPS